VDDHHWSNTIKLGKKEKKNIDGDVVCIGVETRDQVEHKK
jgi:hypothetical protein